MPGQGRRALLGAAGATWFAEQVPFGQFLASVWEQARAEEEEVIPDMKVLRTGKTRYAQMDYQALYGVPQHVTSIHSTRHEET